MAGENIIIGAGLSGLSCGSVLKGGCTILERESYIGGLAVTEEFREFRFDLGGHRFFTQNTSIENFFKELFLGGLLEVERKSKIYRHGKLIDYPLKTSVIFHLNPLDLFVSYINYVLRHLMPLKEESFEETAKNRFGDRLYELFIRDYTEKIWGLKCKELSEELAETRLQNISLKRVIEHALLSKRGDIKSFADTFLYPKNGVGEVAKKLSDGLDIRLDSKVTGFVCSKDRIKKVIINDSREVECENVVSTMPITELTRLLNPPENIREASENLRYRNLICIFLILNKRHYTNNHWIYFPDDQIFGRLHEPKNWSTFMAPEKQTGVCLEIFCNRGDDIWDMTDTEIAHQVIRDLPHLKKFEIEDHFVVKVEYAYPVYDIHYKENLKVVKNYLSSYKNLFLLGRTGSFRYINMDVCLDEGLELGNFLREKERGFV